MKSHFAECLLQCDSDFFVFPTVKIKLHKSMILSVSMGVKLGLSH
jgi:hypothetical protein